MHRIASCALLLSLASCAATPHHSAQRDGCRVLPSASALTDVRMQSLTASQDDKGCRIVGLAPSAAVAAMQQRALMAMATSRCNASATPGDIQHDGRQNANAYTFALLLAPKPGADTCDLKRGNDSETSGVTLDAASRNRNPPRYPPAANRLGIEGRVVLTILVDPAGVPAATLVQTSSGNALLDQSASDAALNWRFRRDAASKHPALLLVRVPVRFAIE